MHRDTLHVGLVGPAFSTYSLFSYFSVKAKTKYDTFLYLFPPSYLPAFSPSRPEFKKPRGK